jgi:hypothetical protein
VIIKGYMGEGAAPSARALEAEEGAKWWSQQWQRGGVVWLGATRGAGDVCAGQDDVDLSQAGHEARRRWASGSQGGAQAPQAAGGALMAMTRLGPGSRSCLCLLMLCSMSSGWVFFVWLVIGSYPPWPPTGGVGSTCAVFNKGGCPRVSLVRRWRPS